MVAIQRGTLFYKRGPNAQWTFDPSKATWFSRELQATHEAFEICGLDSNEFEVVSEEEVYRVVA